MANILLSLFPATDSQDTYCEVMSERVEGIEDDGPKEPCSQSIFSQETEYELPNNADINTNITPSDSLPKSSEVRTRYIFDLNVLK